MARKTTRRIVSGSPRGQRVIIENETLAPAAPTLDEDDNDQDIDSLGGSHAEPQMDPDDDLACLPGEGFVRITRISPNGEKRFLRRVDRDLVSKDIGFIGRTWGGGTYQLEIFNNLSRWVRKLTRTFDEYEYGPAKGPGVAVVQEPGGEEEEAPYAGLPQYQPAPAYSAPAERPAPRPQPTSPMMEMMREMREQNSSHIQNLLQMQKDNTTLMMEAIKATAGNKPANPYADVIETAKLMSRDQGGAGKKTPMEQLVEMLQVFKMLKEEVSASPVAAGLAEGGSFMERMALTFGPQVMGMLLPMIKAGLATDAPRPPARPAVKPTAILPKADAEKSAEAPAVDGSSGAAQAATPPESPPPVAVEPEVVDGGNGNNGHKEGDMKLVDLLKQHPAIAVISGMLLDDAKAGKAVKETADRILAFVGDNEKYNAILDKVLAEEDLTTYLATFEPELANFRAWLDALKKEFFEEEEPVAAPGSGDGEGGSVL